MKIKINRLQSCLTQMMNINKINKTIVNKKTYIQK